MRPQCSRSSHYIIHAYSAREIHLGSRERKSRGAAFVDRGIRDPNRDGRRTVGTTLGKSRG
jgi:hypothetical protein